MASKMFKTYSRMLGLPYVFKTIALFVRQLEALGRRKEAQTDLDDDRGVTLDLLNVDIEVDPKNLENLNEEELAQHGMQLKLIISKILRAIYGSIDEIPPQIRYLFNVISQVINEKFGDVEGNVHYWAIGGLFFLRFFVPAIFFPSTYGLLNDLPCVSAGKQFVLISKIIQTITNLAVNEKEEHLRFLKDFIGEQSVKVKTFYDNLMNMNQGLPYEVPVEIPPVVLATSRNECFNIFSRKLESIKNQLNMNYPDKAHQYIGMINEMIETYAQMERKKPKLNKFKPTRGIDLNDE